MYHFTETNLAGSVWRRGGGEEGEEVRWRKEGEGGRGRKEGEGGGVRGSEGEGVRKTEGGSEGGRE